MSEFRLGETTHGQGATDPGGRPVSLPVADVAAGCGVIAGGAESRPAATASAITAALIDRRVDCVAIDSSGSFDRFAADTGADTAGGERIRPDHAARATERALDRGQPFVLDPAVAADSVATVAAVADATDRGRRADCDPIILVNGSDAIAALAQAGERLERFADPYSGPGLLVSTRAPADLPEPVIDGCRWTVFHRLSRTADTTVVRRVLDGEAARAVRDLSDEEAILAADWRDGVNRVVIDHHSGDDGADRRLAARVDALRADIDEATGRLDALEANGHGSQPVPGTTGEAEDANDPVRATGESDANAAVPGSNGASTDGAGDAFAAVGEVINGDDQLSAENSDETVGGQRGDTEPLHGLPGLVDVPEEPDRRDSDDAQESIVVDSGADLGPVSDDVVGFEAGATGLSTPDSTSDGRPAVVVDLESTFKSLESDACALARTYREAGPLQPVTAYHEATDNADRIRAYSLNRMLRRAGIVEHVGRGRYDYSLVTRIRAGLSPYRDKDRAAVYARDLEQQYLD